MSVEIALKLETNINELTGATFLTYCSFLHPLGFRMLLIQLWQYSHSMSVHFLSVDLQCIASLYSLVLLNVRDSGYYHRFQALPLLNCATVVKDSYTTAYH